MESPAKFREYAAECRRLMNQATPENRERLREIAEAWDRCASDAEGAAAKRESPINRRVAQDSSH
jgi:hypothetical protein